MKNLKEVFIEYKSRHLAIPAFNIDSFEIYQAVELAVNETHLPCIVQLSKKEDEFIQAERLFFLAKKAQVDGLPIYLNMDHSIDPVRLEKLAYLGFDMLHFDGSSMDYSENLKISTDLISKIKNSNPFTLIEVEPNSLSPTDFTQPSEAKSFMDQTHADLLAVSIGNQHGVNNDSPEKLDLGLLKQISDTLSPEQFITLHGGSGISPDQIKTAINLGVVKININTDLRLKFKSSLIDSLATNQSEKVYEYMSPVVNNLKDLVIEKLNLCTM